MVAKPGPIYTQIQTLKTQKMLNDEWKIFQKNVNFFDADFSVLKLPEYLMLLAGNTYENK
jgi:hypothetical protein